MPRLAHLPATFFEPFRPEDPLILALSGGPDSVALGEAFSRSGFSRITVAHFEHGLRGKESRDDQVFCEKKAREWKWDFVTESWASPEGSEEKARLARYEFLERIRQERKAKAISLAHQQDDQTETIFFQFLRGSGLKGLLGMARWDPERKLFRPFLDLAKQEILEFLTSQQIVFRKDSTNLDPLAFDRNFLRLTVFPLLRGRFPHFENTLLRNAALFRELQDLIDGEQERIWEREVLQEKEGEWSFRRAAFLSWSEFLRGTILKRFFFPEAPTYVQVKATEEFVRTAKNGKEKSLLGLKFRVYGENLFVEKLKRSPDIS